MESLQQLAIESFSYRWLSNLRKPSSSFDGLDEHFLEFIPDDDDDEVVGHFIEIEMNPKSHSSMERNIDNQDFFFSVPSSQPLSILHADQLFSNGLLMPLHLLKQGDRESPCSSSYSSSSLSSSSSSLSSSCGKGGFGSVQTHYPFLERCRRSSKRVLWRSSKRILCKYLGFLGPLYRQVVRRKEIGIVGCGNSVITSPRTSITFSPSQFTFSPSQFNANFFDSHIESSIKEAVLHCKKSITGPS